MNKFTWLLSKVTILNSFDENFNCECCIFFVKENYSTARAPEPLHPNSINEGANHGREKTHGNLGTDDTGDIQ